MMSEALKYNSTLTELDLSGDEKEERRTEEMNMYIELILDNNIGDEGAKMISEALECNSTLTKLDLCGDVTEEKK